MIIAGVVLLLVAGGCLWGAKNQEKKISAVKGTRTSTVSELSGISARVSGDMGDGSYKQIVEVKGTVECENPITSELANEKCVYYQMKVTREYEENYTETDQRGNRVQRTRRGSESVAENTRSVEFYVDDGTGRILVNPDGASVDALKAVERFEHGDITGNYRMGNFILDALSLNLGGRRTLGYRYEEHLIPPGQKLFVLGEAVDAEKRLSIRKPSASDKNFIISVKSEEQIVKSAETAKLICLIISGICALTGIGLIIAHIF